MSYASVVSNLFIITNINISLTAFSNYIPFVNMKIVMHYCLSKLLIFITFYYTYVSIGRENCKRFNMVSDNIDEVHENAL